MSDLTKRLRSLIIMDEVASDNHLGRDAADRIEELEAALREAIEDIGEGCYFSAHRTLQLALESSQS